MQGHTQPLSRLVEDQPEPWAQEMRALDSELVLAEDREPDQPGEFVDDLPVSGRSQPRPAPVPDDFRHDMRFHGVRIDRVGVVIADCIPCDWRTPLENGHDLADLISLYAQHAGLDAAKELCLSVLGKLDAAELELPPIEWLPPSSVEDAGDMGDDITDALVPDVAQQADLPQAESWPPPYNADFDNCGGGCKRNDNRRVVFVWYQDTHWACPGCFEEIFGGPAYGDATQPIIELPAQPADLPEPAWPHTGCTIGERPDVIRSNPFGMTEILPEVTF